MPVPSSAVKHEGVKWSVRLTDEGKQQEYASALSELDAADRMAGPTSGSQALSASSSLDHACRRVRPTVVSAPSFDTMVLLIACLSILVCERRLR